MMEMKPKYLILLLYLAALPVDAMYCKYAVTYMMITHCNETMLSA